MNDRLDTLFSGIAAVGFETEKPLSLDQIHKLAIDNACKHQDERGEALTLWTMVRKRRFTVFPTAWENEAEKRAMIAGMRKLLALDKEILRYSFVTEAWAAEASEGEPLPGDDDYVMPSEHPARKEILMVFSFDRKGPHRATVFDMHRTAEDKIVRKENREYRDMQADGAVWNLFRPPEEVMTEQKLRDQLRH